MTAPEKEPGTEPTDDALPGYAAVAGVVLLTLSGAFAGAIECLLVPTYLGATIFPITLVLAVVSNVLLPWLGYSLAPRTAAAAGPFVAWLVVVLALALITRPEGDVILPGGGHEHVELVGYGLLLLGAIAGGATVSWVSAPSRAAGREPFGPGRPGRPGQPGQPGRVNR